MNPPVTSINDLPPEMIRELFKYLPPKELVVCSMVNTLWYSISATIKLHSLATIESAPYDLINWHDSNQPILEKDQCTRVIFRVLAEKPLLSNLRHLALCGYEFKYDLNKLNRFEQLVHLEINCFLFSKKGVPERKVHLKLAKLKVLAFHRSNRDCHLSVDCLELSTLLYRGEERTTDLFYRREERTTNLLEVKHPETIRKLSTNMLASKLAPFRAVECLVTERFKAIRQATLDSLPKLRELHYNGDIKDPILVKQTLSEFMNVAKRLRGEEFQFTFAGVQLTNVNMEQINFDVEVDEDGIVPHEYFHMKNYHLIVEPGALNYVRRIDYTRLMRQVTGEFPHCFSQKFTCIYQVNVDGSIEDSDHFLRLLKSLRSLRSLELETELSQEFYDQLPTSAHSLVSLGMKVGHCEPQFNFSFVEQLSRLLHLTIYLPLSLESATSLVRSSGRLTECFFYTQSKRNDFRIEKYRYLTKWKIYTNECKGASLSSFSWSRGASEEQLLQLKIQNSDEMLDFFEALQSM